MVRQRPHRAFYLQIARFIGTACVRYRRATANLFIPSSGPQHVGPPFGGVLRGPGSLDGRPPKKLGGIGRRRSTFGYGHKPGQIEEDTSERFELKRSRGGAGCLRAHAAPLYRGRSYRLSPAARRALPDPRGLDRRVLGETGRPASGTPCRSSVDVAGSSPATRYPQTPNPDWKRERDPGLRPFRRASGRAAFSRSNASGLRTSGALR